MIFLLRIMGKIVKWVVIAIAWLIAGVVKVVAIAIVLAFFGTRAAIRHVRDGTDDEDADPYFGFYDLERRADPPSGDSFDAAVQRERDHRVARSRKERVE
jgi:hypothetical protein